MEINDFLSEQDTKRFGFKIAKVNDFSYGYEKILSFLKLNDVKLVISRIDSNNLMLINTLEKVGFLIKDFRLTYNYELSKFSKPQTPLNNDFVLHDVDKNQIDQIVNIAKSSFKNYGHYFANERLDKICCEEIYMDWAKRSCLNKEVADKVIVAIKNDIVLGFQTFKACKIKGEKFLSVGLGAVAANSRKLGVYSSIILQGLIWGKKNKFKRLEICVLATNYAANHININMGFNIINSEITLHCWLDNNC